MGEIEKLQERLRDAEVRYASGKNVIEQNKANLDMMLILNRIEKLKNNN